MKTIVKIVAIVDLVLAIVAPSYGQDGKVTPREMFNSFKQTDKDNCASVAEIKAAISVFGMDSVFLSMRRDSVERTVIVKNDSVKVNKIQTTVITRDGTTIIITPEEYDIAAAHARFRLNKDTTYQRFREIRDFAVLCYAVMGKKRDTMEKLGGYEKGLSALDRGTKIQHANKFLGLKRENVLIKRRFTRTRGYGHMIVYNWKHAGYASYGDMDLWGKRKRIRKLWYYGRIVMVKKTV